MSDVSTLDSLLATKRQLDTRISASPAAVRRLAELRRWQAARLAQTYADLRHEPQCREAIEFFLSDVYGPQDLTRRDAAFERAWRPLKRALPAAALKVLGDAIELEVLSAELDQEMMARLADGPVDRLTYEKAYRALGRVRQRRRQIDLVLSIGTDLTRLVDHPAIGLALRAARIPARLSGLDALQDFLERGYHAFRKMTDPQRLLSAIAERETAFMNHLLDGV
ncbi:MAG TPA: hypothetical protein VHB68_06090 [Steroidobacteraceae bacterium]|nr:hypothetical protein [Steroidobacteraceae bacterium]